MKNKKIVVIGGSSGIGLAIVNELTTAENHVIHLARNKGDWEHPDQVDHYEMDITSGKVPEIEGIDEIHGMVYCPGTINLKPFQKLTAEEFTNDFQINVLGAVMIIQHFYKELRKGKAGIVLFSTVAVNPGMAFHASVGAAKGAVEGLTRSLAAEFAPHIRVNAVAPSLTDTPLASKILSSEDKREASNKRHPLGRFGQPSDIASMAVYLLDEKASWMTGQVIGVDGGMAGTR